MNAKSMKSIDQGEGIPALPNNCRLPKKSDFCPTNIGVS